MDKGGSKGNLICRALGVLLLASVLFACNGEVKQNLTEAQADEILVALKERGLDAEKKRIEVNREVTFNVITRKSKLDDARRILVVMGLPREKMIGIEQICGGNDSLIPSPSIDRCKMQLALQNEIIRALTAIEGVVEVKVNINIPEQNVLSDQASPRPTAAVMVKYIPDDAGKLPFEEKKVREYVANSVDNLDFNDVTILATPARIIKATMDEIAKANSRDAAASKEKETIPLSEQVSEEAQVESSTFLGLDLAPHSVKKFKVLVLVATVFFFILGCGMIITVLHAQQVKTAHERLLRRQKGARPANYKALRAAPQSVIPFQTPAAPPAANFPAEEVESDVDQYGVN